MVYHGKEADSRVDIRDIRSSPTEAVDYEPDDLLCNVTLVTAWHRLVTHRPESVVYSSCTMHDNLVNSASFHT